MDESNKNDDKYVTLNGKKYHKVDKLFKDELIKTSFGDLPSEDQENRIFVQKYALISFLNPEKVRNTKVRGVMIRGVYPTEELAKQKADELRDKYFDVYLAPVGEWVVHNPDPGKHASKEAFAEDEKELNELMIAHKKNRDKADQAESLRRQRIKEEGTEEVVDKRRQETINRLRAKQREKEQKREALRAKRKLGNKHVEAGKMPEDEDEPQQKTLKQMKEVIEEDDELGKKERQRLMKEKEEVNKEEQELNTVKQRIDKIKKLHEKMKNKVNKK